MHETKMIFNNRVVSWKELVSKITPTHGIIGNIYRSQRLYEQNKLKVRACYASYGDFIKITVLNHGSFLNADGLMEAFKTSTSFDYVMVENMYPYNLRKGIHHDMIWAIQPIKPDLIDNIIRAKRPDAKNIVWFVNEEQYMSVPELWHCHIFWKGN